MSGPHHPTMTAAEFRIAREHLGVTGEWLGVRLGVTGRTIRRWESGAQPIPRHSAESVQAEIDTQDEFVADVVNQLRDYPAPDEHGQQWATVYPDDAELQSAWPHIWYPASWHRAALARAAQQIPLLRLRYPTEDEGTTMPDYPHNLQNILDALAAEAAPTADLPAP